MHNNSRPNNLSKLLFVSIVFLAFSDCSTINKADPFDRQNVLTKNEVKEAFSSPKSTKNKLISTSSFPKIPSIKTSRMLSAPLPPTLGGEKMISLSITEKVPLKDVLIEIGRSAKLDIDIEPEIDGGIILNAKNRPLKEVLDRISDMGNLRYSFDNNVLHFERDLPYAKHYLVDYLIDSALWAEVQSNATSIVTSSSAGSQVSANKAAGILTIFATNKKHSEVTKYLEMVKKSASAQVLIEAKVVEVTLNDNYKTGIDWSWTDNAVVGKSVVDFSGGGAGSGNPISYVLSPRKLFGGTINGTINALEEFGVVKAVASPRINALNNQKANLNFTKKLVYFTSEVSTNATTTSTTTNAQNTVTSTKNEVDTGTILDITPSIDLKTNEITLNVQPKIIISNETVTQKLTAPGVNGGKDTIIENAIPIINTRELTTVAKVQSGEILVIGGVMTEGGNNTDKGIPFLSRVPFLGHLFKSTTRTSTVSETVIFIKATIIHSNSGASKYDREIHDKFSTSVRPFMRSEK